MSSGEGLIGDRSAPTGLDLPVGTSSQGFTLGYYRASLREEGRRLNGGEVEREPFCQQYAFMQLPCFDR
jgi:hypothetical protein